jgi:prevent-host-death family protein
MRHIQASEAKTHLPSLLDDVERGETLVITRHGKPIARLVPDEAQGVNDVRKAVEDLIEFRKTMPKITLDEMLSARHEGHLY